LIDSPGRHARRGVIRAACTLQSVFRSFLSRRRLRGRLDARVARDRHALYADAATRIQRVWRGFFSRKVRHDFYARREYIREIERNAEVFRREMDAVGEDMAVEAERREEEDARAEFRCVGGREEDSKLFFLFFSRFFFFFFALLLHFV
jgi:hypothetical protein